MLHLIQKSEMDILDLPIAEITTQYLAFIKQQEAMALDVASEYLVMAATLLRIKSADLLPPEIEDTTVDIIDEESIDTKEALMLQLLTYQQFQIAAKTLEYREHAEKQSFTREPALVPSDLSPNTALSPGLTLVDLQLAFSQILLRKQREDPISRSIVRERYSLNDAMASVTTKMSQLSSGERLSFKSFFVDLSDREILVMNFFALLELVKESRLILHQEMPTAEIFIEIGSFNDE